MSWPNTGATHYQAQLGLQDKVHVIKEFVLCWTLPYLIFWAIERFIFNSQTEYVQGGVERTSTRNVTLPPRRQLYK